MPSRACSGPFPLCEEEAATRSISAAGETLTTAVMEMVMEMTELLMKTMTV